MLVQRNQEICKQKETTYIKICHLLSATRLNYIHTYIYLYSIIEIKCVQIFWNTLNELDIAFQCCYYYHIFICTYIYVLYNIREYKRENDGFDKLVCNFHSLTTNMKVAWIRLCHVALTDTSSKFTDTFLLVYRYYLEKTRKNVIWVETMT